MNPTIICVSGRICSGKGFICTKIAVGCSAEHIVVSDIVRSLINSSDRSSLQDTAQLCDVISHQLAIKVQFALDSGKNVIIDGVRQREVLNHTLNLKQPIEFVWVDASVETRRQRFTDRKSNKDNINFDQAEYKDNLLGISELEVWFKDVNLATIVHND